MMVESVELPALLSGRCVLVETDTLTFRFNAKCHGRNTNPIGRHNHWKVKMTIWRNGQPTYTRAASFDYYHRCTDMIDLYGFMMQLVTDLDITRRYNWRTYRGVSDGPIRLDRAVYQACKATRCKLERLFGLRLGQFVHWVKQDCLVQWGGRNNVT